MGIGKLVHLKYTFLRQKITTFNQVFQYLNSEIKIDSSY